MNSFADKIRSHYQLPKTDNDAMRYLADILDIPMHYLNGDGSKIVAAMAGTVLYRHLDQRGKVGVMTAIRQLKYGPLQSRLVGKCTDSIVNAQWAEWSLTSEELEGILHYHNEFNRWSSILGANPGAYGVGASVWGIIQQGLTKGNLIVLSVSFILIGIHEFSYQETQKYSKELERRKTFIGGK